MARFFDPKPISTYSFTFIYSDPCLYILSGILLYLGCVFAGCVVFDMPYGVFAPNVASWDIVLEPEHVQMFIRQVNAVCTTDPVTIVLFHNRMEFPILAKALADGGFT